MQPTRNTRETLFLAGLTCVATVLALITVQLGQATWLEAAAFVTGAICVWLVVKQNLWNFPIGIVNAAVYCVVYYEIKLYADTGLQVVYFVLQWIGWYEWLYGGERHTRLHVVRASVTELAVLAVLVVVAALSLWKILLEAGGSAPFWDALTASLSLAAQCLLTRKRLENWIVWIAVDIIYVPLYVYKGVYLTALLYTVFLTMAVLGLRAWRTSWLADRVSRTEASPKPVEAI